MGPDNPQDSFGPSFRPNGRFSTHFGPNLMFLAPTGTLVSQDLGLAWLWTSPIAAGKPNPLSETSTSVLSQQQTSVLSQQQTSVLSQQQTSASAFITQHQHSASTISILWRLRQQPTSGYHEGWDIKRPCAPMVAMIPTGYGFGYSQTRMT